VGQVQRRQGGTGLGLAISRQLVHLMSSEIRVRSEPGRGSTFWFEITAPTASGAALTTRDDRTIRGYEGERRKVLVIDDVAENRAVVADLLTPLGFRVLEAADGRTGVALAQSEAPDLVLMDSVMPLMDGLQATIALRASAVTQGTPVIAISASASAEDQEQSIAAGANAFLPKPLDFDHLLERMGALLRITWIYGPVAPMVDDESGNAGLTPPPPEEIEILHSLALSGNMRGLRARSAHLASVDQRYRPFADKLRRLADR